MKDFDLEEELKKLPNSPGVYIMHSKSEEILYVGKAVNLHNRVRQYFRKGYGHNGSLKIASMVSQVAYFEYIVTSSEMEALVLECNLIKEHRPKYNTLMTDDKGYPYIKVTVDEKYPRVLFSHRIARDKSRYFGPFTDRSAVHDTVVLTKKLFKIRNCNKSLTRPEERPCLYYQIGQCTAPCTGLVSPEDYSKQVDAAIRFLNGNHKEITDELVLRMKKYSEMLEFEKAAETRDLIESIKAVMEKQKVSSSTGDDKDIIAIARNDKDAVVSVFFVRDGNLLGRDNHHLSIDSGDSDIEIITDFIKQYYTSTPFIPKEIITPELPEDLELITEFLESKRGHKVYIHVPQKGEMKALIKLATDNAALVLSQDIERIKRKEKRTIGACMEIAELLGIEKASRMEAFDISHISGYNQVASMVVFENGEPHRNAYRKFRLKSIDGPDDYASMKEVLSRRFTNEKMDTLPDVIMMDGGKGQVNTAVMVLDSLGLEIPVCGMVKDDKHRTRGLYYNNEELTFKAGSEAINMITALQDETHRFAITYHKLLRSKEQVHSILDEIEGIGPKRRKALLLHFKNIEAIKSASIEDLTSAPGMNRAAAEKVYEFFNK